MHDWETLIDSNPQILFGKPIIKGTRIPVELILEKLSLGETVQSVLDAYPSIQEHQIRACLAFAAASLKNERVTYF
ncbi:MAG: DUF433 domain-containing protein [Chloroherpetonaceae bacterium]|nr:DUF433 domain-containing protein [Chloroherpetonaceae bacterium]